jgi:glc operon protein GlcG
LFVTGRVVFRKKILLGRIYNSSVATNEPGGGVLSATIRHSAVASAVVLVLLGVGPAAQEPTGAGGGPLSPTLPEALNVIAAARAAAAKMHISVGCAVVDATGQPIAVQRMDDARFFTVDIARNLAMNAALSGGPSESASAQNTKNLPKQARIYGIKGGLPLTHSGRIVGAVACHGATPDQDAEAARAGERAF